MKRSGLRLITTAIALVGSISTTILFAATFITAYLAPSQTTIVDVASVGEGTLELILLALFWPFMLVFWASKLIADATAYANDRYPLYVTIEDQ